MSGPCCGSAPQFLTNNAWTCSECGSAVDGGDSQIYFSDVFNSGYYGSPPKQCECGADKTYGVGSNTHATWCPLYKK